MWRLTEDVEYETVIRKMNERMWCVIWVGRLAFWATAKSPIVSDTPR